MPIDRATGVIKAWNVDEGCGVIASASTPGGCWAHYSAVDASLGGDPVPGTEVLFEFKRAHQTPYRYRATRVWLPAAPPPGHDPR